MDLVNRTLGYYPVKAVILTLMWIITRSEGVSLRSRLHG